MIAYAHRLSNGTMIIAGFFLFFDARRRMGNNNINGNGVALALADVGSWTEF